MLGAIREDILGRYQDMLAKGKLRPTTQLEEYCTTFRKRFGPEQLMRMDGPILLESMHDHSKRDSLVYWLEFKDDEEYNGPIGLTQRQKS
jgi:5-methylcytosine-specific restriction protein B